MTKPSATPRQLAAAAAALLPGLPVADILARYQRAKGNEIGADKFASLESSSALAANAFGFFLNRPNDMPPLPGWNGNWRPTSVLPEAEVRFPWRGGLHPWLDVIIETDEHLVGVESKRYEPFRTHTKAELTPFSDAYWRDVWGKRMGPFEWARDRLAKRPAMFKHLDAVQLVKHAFGLRTQANPKGKAPKAPVLAYVYAEPKEWPQPNGKPLPEAERALHAEEVRCFARLVSEAEVRLMAFSYGALISAWASAPSPDLQRHADLLRRRFDC